MQRVFDMMTDPDKVYIPCFYGLEDLLFPGGFAHAVRDKFDKKSAVLITQERFHSFDIEFDGVSEIKYMSYDEFIAFTEWLKVSHIYATDNYIWGNYKYDENGRPLYHVQTNFVDRFKRDVFDLPLDTPYHPPRVKEPSNEEKLKLRNDYIIDRERTVILTPYANSEGTWRPEFGKNVVEYLKRHGFIVYTNVNVSKEGTIEQPLEGALPLFTTLNEMYWLADKVRCFIGVRSGLFDLLAFADATIFCTSYLRFTWNLELIFPDRKARIHTFTLCPVDEEGNFKFRPVFSKQLENFHIDKATLFASEEAQFEALTKSIETTLNLNNTPSAERIFELMTNPDKLYLVCPFRLGDMVLVGVLVHAVLERSDKKSAVLIVQDSFKGFDVKFDGVSEIKYAAPDDLLSFKDYVRENNEYAGDNWIYAHYHMNAEGKFIFRRGFDFFGTFKRNIFGLPLNTPFRAPTVDDISDDAKVRLVNNYEIDRERTVILAPHANLYRPLSVEFWNDLISRLKAEGCVVYTNIARKTDGTMEMPLDGTLPMRVSLNEIYWLADKVRCIIGMRSGLLDLLAFSKAKIYCLAYRSYSNDLKRMIPETPSDIRTLYMAGPYTSDQPKAWNIAPDNVFTREISLFQSLIKSLDAGRSLPAPKENLPPEVVHIFGLMTDPDKLYAVVPYRIGDMIIIGGFASELRRKSGKTSIVLIVQERLRSLDVKFDDVSDIEYVPPEELIAFRNYVRATKKYIGDNYIYAHYAFNARNQFIYTRRMNFLDRCKGDMCDLPLDALYHPPLVTEISDETKAKLHSEYIIDKERTVIIAPHSNTYHLEGDEFWRRLTERLNRSSFTVYTNIGMKSNGELEAPLDGTLSIRVSLNEIFYLADKVRCIIGMRSGLFDLLVFSKGTMFCISNAAHLDLKQMFPASDSTFRTMYLMPSYPPEKIKRWKLRAEDFFDTDDALIDELSKSVEAL